MTDIFENKILPVLEEHRGDWLAGARSVAETLGANGETVTINDVRDRCPPPADVDPRVMGAVFTRKRWECIGYIKSNRGTCHNRPIGLFRMKPKAA